MTASASGPNLGIFLPCFSYVFLNRLVNSSDVISLLFLSSFTLSKKWRVNATSIPTALNSYLHIVLFFLNPIE